MKIKTRTPAIEQYFFNWQDYSYLRAPLQELVNQARKGSPSLSELCIGVTFYFVDPDMLAPATSDFRRTPGTSTLVSINSYDQRGQEILLGAISPSSGVGQVTALSTPIDISYQYSFPPGANESNFDLRDATCSHFSPIDNIGNWSHQECDTTINFAEGKIDCACNYIHDSLFTIMKPKYSEPVVAEPDFNIVKLDGPGPADIAVASMDSSFGIDMLNFSSTTELVRSSVTPAEKINFSKVKLDERTGRFDFAAGALVEDQNYQLSYEARETVISPFGKVYTTNVQKQHYFRTPRAPYGGTITVSPFTGYEDLTNFNLEISGWIDEFYPLTVAWSPTNIPRPEPISFDNQVKNVDTRLPLIKHIDARITNDLGIYVDLKIPVDVKPQPMTWQQLIDRAFAREKVHSTLWDLWQIVPDYCAQARQNELKKSPMYSHLEVPTDVDFPEANGYNKQIIAKIEFFMSRINPVQVIYGQLRVQQAVSNLVEVMESLWHCQEMLEEDDVRSLTQIMVDMNNLGSEYDIYLQDDEHMKKVLHMVNDCFEITHSEVDLIDTGRLFVRNCLAFKSYIQDTRCRSNDDYF